LQFFREECELVRVGGGDAAVGVLESLARIAEQREQLQVSLDSYRTDGAVTGQFRLL
jgi:hypothetical protein